MACPGAAHASDRKAEMPKQKTHKGIQKRFKVTASGKAKHRKANRGHRLGKMTGKRKRRLRSDGVVVGLQANTIVEALRPAS
jgi:large subunit ribosomal protein L35